MTLNLEQFCDVRLGSPLARTCFTKGFLNNVYGVELADGRQLVIKEHPSSAGIEAIIRTRGRLSRAGVGCPPIVEVVDDRIVVEPLIAGGEIPDPHSPEGVGSMATLLARIVLAGAPTEGLVGVPWADHRHGLYPQPPGMKIDFSSSAGVEWADELASEAATRLRSATGTIVAGHGDFQAQNIRFAGSEPVAVFDWDSLVADVEPAIVGFAAAMFVDVGDDAEPECASPDEREAFVSAYERAAGHD
ncbi:MAG: phosphotransferase, partial [bacterium]